MEIKKNEKKNIIDLDSLMEKEIFIEFVGGRKVYGILKGFDVLTNLVLEYCKEIIYDPDSIEKKEKYLGKVLCRGTMLSTVSLYNN